MLLDRAASSSQSAKTGQAKRSSTQLANDRALANAVRTRLAADASTKGLALVVEAQDGIAILRGQVRTAQQRADAERVARSVQGVKAVRNELRIR